MVADELVTQGARASVATELTFLSREILVSGPEGLTVWYPHLIKSIKEVHWNTDGLGMVVGVPQQDG